MGTEISFFKRLHFGVQNISYVIQTDYHATQAKESVILIIRAFKIRIADFVYVYSVFHVIQKLRVRHTILRSKGSGNTFLQRLVSILPRSRGAW